MKKILFMFFFISCNLGIITAAEGDSYEPKILKATNNANVLLYLRDINIGVTAIKTDYLSPVIIKSENSKAFKIIKFTSITLTEAITKEGKTLAYMLIELNAKEKTLVKLNKLIKKGKVEFKSILDNINENDCEQSISSSKEPPDPKKFVKMRNVLVNNFIIEDNKKNQFPLQIYVEYYQDAK